MCKAPKPPKPKEPKKPEFLRNRYLDGALGQSNVINSLRSGRSSMRIPLAGAAPTGVETTPPPAPTPNPLPRPTPINPIGPRRGGRGRENVHQR